MNTKYSNIEKAKAGHILKKPFNEKIAKVAYGIKFASVAQVKRAAAEREKQVNPERPKVQKSNRQKITLLVRGCVLDLGCSYRMRDNDKESGKSPQPCQRR